MNSCLVLACVASFVLTTPASADTPLGLTLRADIQVPDHRWSLADAIEATPEVVLVTGIDRVVLNAPQAGHLLHYRPAQLERLIRSRADRALPPFAWSGAAGLKVVRKTQMVPAAALEQAAVSAIRAQAALAVQESVQADQPMPDLEVPVGQYTLRPRFNAHQNGGRRVGWIDVVIDGRVVRSAAVFLRVGTTQPAYIAARTLLAGEVVQGKDLMPADPVAHTGQASIAAARPAARRLRRSVREGEAVSVDAFMVAGAVRRGDTVDLLVRDSVLTLEAKGIASNDAVPGQMVAVRWAHAHDLVRGRLDANGKVVIE